MHFGEHEPTIEADDMFFSIKQARNGGITEQLIGSLISATDVEDGDIAFGDNEINYLKVKNFDDRKIESARDKDIIEIVLEAKDSYGNITQKDYIHHIYGYQGQGENQSLWKD